MPLVTRIFEVQIQACGARLRRTIMMTLPAGRAILFGTVIFPLVGRPMMNKSMQALKARLEAQPKRGAS